MLSVNVNCCSGTVVPIPILVPLSNNNESPIAEPPVVHLVMKLSVPEPPIPPDASTQSKPVAFV